MTYFIQIESKESFEWLAKLIQNTIETPNSKVMINSYEHVRAWHDALSSYELIEEPKVRKSRQPKPEKNTDPDPFTCKDHPSYQAKQVPRKDCKVCWNIYKKFHPLDYDKKRRDFERKRSNVAK